MIDLHSHLLPGVDDGSTSVGETENMLALWDEYGFERVAATHHLAGDLRDEYRSRMADAVDEVAQIIDRSNVDVVVGFEIMLDPGLPDRLERGAPLTLGNSRSLLVEVPFLSWPNYTEQVIFALQLAGYQPILAHPERYDDVQANLSLATSLAERGVVLQLTYASLAGTLGSGARKTAERLIELDLPMILASDAHGARQRLLAVPDGLRRAEELVGSERLRQLTTEVPRALLVDSQIPEPVSPQPTARKPGRLEKLRRGS